MRKTTLKNLIFWMPISAILLFVSLSIFGRAVGDKPLPWHLAWLACFGDGGWRIAFEHSIRPGWTKAKVRQVLGDPDLVIFDGKPYSPEEIDLGAFRNTEIWGYKSPYSASAGSMVIFRDNKFTRK